ASPSSALDLGRAIHIVNQIGDLVNASLGIEPVLETLLTVIRRELPTADAGEIGIWDERQRVLQPRGWTGDTAYVLSLAEAGGVYREDEGISGWIARYKRPVLVEDVDDAAAVRPKLDTKLYRSYIGVPLVVGERFIGTLEFASAKRFTPNDLALLQ